jgi:hypothetical protein
MVRTAAKTVAPIRQVKQAPVLAEVGICRAKNVFEEGPNMFGVDDYLHQVLFCAQYEYQDWRFLAIAFLSWFM